MRREISTPEQQNRDEGAAGKQPLAKIAKNPEESQDFCFLLLCVLGVLCEKIVFLDPFGTGFVHPPTDRLPVGML